MSKIKVALVGRPNVGKSALFNRICKKRISIVDEEEGVTRDRLYTDADFFGRPFTLIDTGGIDPFSDRPFNEEIKWQARVAIEEADILIMVVDATCGATQLDKEVVSILYKSKKPLVLAVNKVDDKNQENLVTDFYQLGIKKLCPVSAVHGTNIAELLEMGFDGVDWPEEEEEEKEHLKIAIVGRANVGKSTLFNYLLDEERSVVSPIAGTTRDSVDVWLKIKDQEVCFIDTAGIRRKKAEHFVVDKFAAMRTERAIDRSDICLFLLDANEGMTSQEKRIAKHIEDSGKGVILLFNKWDLAKGYRIEHCEKAVVDEVPFFKHCPMIFMSAKTGKNVDKIFDTIKAVEAESKKRIPTSKLNNFIEKCIQKTHPPMIQGRRLRIYYLTQIGTPAKFILFVNRKSLLLASYKKYLINQLRDEFAFSGIPVQFYTREKATQKRYTFRE